MKDSVPDNSHHTLLRRLLRFGHCSDQLSALAHGRLSGLHLHLPHFHLHQNKWDEGPRKIRLFSRHKPERQGLPLPDDVILEICSYFAFNTVVTLRVVNKQFLNVINDHLPDIIENEIRAIDRHIANTAVIEMPLLLISQALIGYAAVCPCPESPPVEVVHWVKKAERRVVPIARIIGIIRSSSFPFEYNRFPKPLITHWGRHVAYYWKFVEQEFGQATPFTADYSRFFEIHSDAANGPVPNRNNVDFSSLSDRKVLSLGVSVLQLYGATYLSVPIDQMELFEAAFVLGPEYVAQWVDCVNIFLPKTKKTLQKRLLVINKTQMALKQLGIAVGRPSLEHQLRCELEKRHLMDIGEEVILD
ncbi:uncharacterized protein V1513DRAFT_451831 [Lipomyces chichibuensis]|uniref:uncharacterized protein n=1 Tax=Lipomyces chichibuensis TaxID=1546026 RepID=UPI003343B29B